MVSPLSHGLGNKAIQVLTLFSGHTGRGRSGLAASVGACSKYPLISSGIVYEPCYLELCPSFYCTTAVEVLPQDFMKLSLQGYTELIHLHRF